MSPVAAMRPMLPACLVLSRPPAPQALVYDGRLRHNMCLLPHAPHAPRLLGTPVSGLNFVLFAPPPLRVVAATGRTTTGCKWSMWFKSAASCAPPRKPHVAARCRPATCWLGSLASFTQRGFGSPAGQGRLPHGPGLPAFERSRATILPWETPRTSGCLGA